MKDFRSVGRRVRALFSRKLGVCPFCMRTAGLGTLCAWGLYAASAFVLPQPALRAVLAVIATAFTLLTAGHIVAFVARAVARARGLRRCRARAGHTRPAGIGRREFFDLVLKASAYAILASLPGATRALAQLFPPCGKTHVQTGNPAAALNELSVGLYVERAKQVCDDFCASTVFHSPCPPADGTCVQTAKPVVSEPKLVGGFIQGRVKECTCECRACQGDYEPLPPDDMASGTGATEAAAEQNMNATAANKCQKLCDKLKDCTPPVPTCKHIAHQLGKKKHTGHGGGVTVEAKILKCTCDCV